MFSVCSNASSKTWMPLPDPFIDEHLVEMFQSLFDQARLQLVNVMHPAAMLPHHPMSGSLPGSGQDCWLATELE